MSKAAVAVLEPEVMAPAVEASWDRARQLVAEIGDWHKIIELGRVLQALYHQYNAGLGGDRKSGNAQQKSISARGNRSESGWCDVVRRELGMTPQTALRAIERGTYVEQVACVMSGEELEYKTTKGEWKKLNPTPEIQEKAKEVLSDILQGANAGRAWAGFVGETTRRGRYGTPSRAPVDHCRNLLAAITKLENSLKEWRHLNPDERAMVEKQWHGRVTPNLPDTFTNQGKGRR